MTVLHQAPYVTILDGDGDPVSGAQAYFYDAGTTTPKAVYADPGLTTPHTSPVVADSAGRLPPIYLPSGTYKVRYETSTGVLVEEQDNVDPGQSTSAGVLGIAQGGTGAGTIPGAQASLQVPSLGAFDALDERVADVEAELAAPIVYDAAVITWASAITPDYSAANIRSCVLAGTTSVNAATGLSDGQPFILALIQDASGNRSISINAAFKFPGGSAPQWSVTANAVDVIEGYQKASGDLQVTAVKIQDNLNRPAPDIIVQQTAAAASDGGTATQGAWQTRALNTLARNRNNLGSLASNQITLPAGTYFMDGWSAGYKCKGFQTRIYNITDATEVALGGVQYAEGDVAVSVTSIVDGAVVTIAASKAFALQSRVESTRSTDGYGKGSAWSTNVFAGLRIWKLF
jgi:hypothetical protein